MVGPVEDISASPERPFHSALFMTLLSRMAILVPSDYSAPGHKILTLLQNFWQGFVAIA